MANARLSPVPMTARPSVPRHGRPHQSMPPVYGTAVPLHGPSGLVRRIVDRYPDRVAAHWLLLGDRVDSWGARVRGVFKGAVPLSIAVAGARRLLAR